MYPLTLTADERKAFDWVGYRYAAGEIKDLLFDCISTDDWDCNDSVEYQIPEHVAWRLKELAEGESYAFPCFSDELKLKMIRFCESIV